MGQPFTVPPELTHHCSWILGLREGKGKDLLPCKGGVYFYTPTVFSCLDSWCLLCSESCLAELIESFVEEGTQTGVIGSSSFQEHRRAGIELSGIPSWIQLKLWARPAADPAWQEGNPLGGETAFHWNPGYCEQLWEVGGGVTRRTIWSGWKGRKETSYH